MLNNEHPVISFMDNLDKTEDYNKDMNDIRNSHDIKLRMLNRCREDAKHQCMDRILSNIYKDAIPFNDEYKAAYPEEMRDDFKKFVDRQAAPNDYIWYIKETLKRNNQFMNRMCEAVEELVNDHYADKELNIDQVDPDDLVFRADDNMLRKIDIIGKDLGSEDIASTIKDNVKQAVLSEINRAKAEKSELKNLENELSQDNNINTPAAVEAALDIHNFKKDIYYKPTLFESMVVYSYNNLTKEKEAGTYESKNTYNTMKEFTEEDHDEMLDRAFIESVKEYTCFSILNALKLESFTAKDINDIAMDYATSK